MKESIINEIIRAQDAYNQVIEKYKDVDCNEILFDANEAIKFGISKNSLGCATKAFEDFAAIQKAAIELEKLGYHVAPTPTEKKEQLENSQWITKPAYYLYINWKVMPVNSRDEFTI